MPDSCIVKSAHQDRQKRKLHRTVEDEPSENGKHAETDCRSVGQFLQRIIWLVQFGLWGGEKKMKRHGPKAADITREEEHLPIIFAEDFIGHVECAGEHVNPDESEMPLQRAAEPASERQLPGDIHEICFRDFCAEAGEGAEDLQAAPDQNE